jgi:hypothetical protein
MFRYVLCLSVKGAAQQDAFCNVIVTGVPPETQSTLQQYTLAYMWHQYNKTNELFASLHCLFEVLRQLCRAYHLSKLFDVGQILCHKHFLPTEILFIVVLFSISLSEYALGNA